MPISNVELLDVYSSNDLYQNAQIIEGVSGTVPGTLIGSTGPENSGSAWEVDWNSPSPSPPRIRSYWLDNGGDHSVWYKWVAPYSGTFYFELTHQADADMALDMVVDSTDYSNGRMIAISENTNHIDLSPRMAARVVSSKTYYIRVSSDMEHSFALGWGPTTPPINSEIAGAIDLKVPASNVLGTNFDALTEEGINSEELEDVPTVWYKYTNRQSKPILFTFTVQATNSVENEFAIELWKGIPSATTAEFGEYISPGDPLQARVSPGQTIYFSVLDDWFYSEMGSFTYSWTAEEAPYSDVAAIVTAYDPAKASLLSGDPEVSKYAILGVNYLGEQVDILKTSTLEPYHPHVSVVTDVGNIYFMDQVDNPVSVPYRVSMWRYTEGTTGHSAGFEAPSFDDSAWTVGQTPFGPTGYTVSGYSANTTVPQGAGRELCVRRKILGPGTLQMWFALDDGMQVWIDGVSIHDSLTTSQVAYYNDAITLSTTLTEGEHVIAIRRRDNGGGANWFDVRWTVTPTVTSTSPSIKYVRTKLVDGTPTVLAEYATKSNVTRFKPSMFKNDDSAYVVGSSYPTLPDQINLVPAGDGSFETAEVNPWTFNSNTLIDAVSSQAAHGLWSMRVHHNPADATAPTWTLGAQSDYINIHTMDRPADNKYFLNIQLKDNGWTTNSLTNYARVSVLYYNSSNTWIGTSTSVYFAGANISDVNWTDYNNGTMINFTTPASARKVRVYLDVYYVPNNSAELYVDKVGIFPDPGGFTFWRAWTPEQKLDNPNIGIFMNRDPGSWGAGIYGIRYASSYSGTPEIEDHKYALTAGGGEFDTFGITPDDPTLEVNLHAMHFQLHEHFLLYKRNTLDNTLTGTLAEYLTSVHNGTGYPWMNLSRTYPGSDVRLHYMSNGNLFFAAELVNCIYTSVAFEITIQGVLVAAYPNSKVAEYPFQEDGTIIRRPMFAGPGAYSCPDPGGDHFWVINYEQNASPVWKVPYVTTGVPVESIGTLEAGLKPTHMAPHFEPYVPLDCGPDWWNCSYVYRKVLKFTGTEGGLPTNHPATVVMAKDDTLEQGKMRQDLADVQAIYHNGEDFFLLEQTITEDDDYITVTFPLMESIAEDAISQGEYFIYYGNPDLENAPSPFDFVYTPPTWPTSLDLLRDISYTMPGMDWKFSLTQATSTEPGAKAAILLYGSKFRIMANTSNVGGMIEVHIDDEIYYVDLFSVAPEYDVEVFSIEDLTQKMHTVRLVVSNETNVSSLGHKVEITSIDVWKLSQAEIIVEEIIPLRWTSTVGSRH